MSPNDLRLNILGNKKTLEKSQNCMEMQRCDQFYLQKKIFVTGAQDIELKQISKFFGLV